MDKRYLVMNIGCIECGVSSAVVGVFSDRAYAEQVSERCQAVYDWREGGQNSFEVFELPAAIDVTAREYSEAGAATK